MPSPPGDTGGGRLITEKDRLRRDILVKRKSLDPGQRKDLSERIVRNIVRLPEFRRARRVALFVPLKGEPDITPLFPLVAREKELILPKVSGESLLLLRVNYPPKLSKGKFGVQEPEEGQEVSPEEVDLILVPGVVFDLRGFRIGFGKGYYDRLLDRIRGLKAGVAFSFQVLGSVPHDPWDVPVDILITEKFVRRFRDGRT